MRQLIDLIFVRFSFSHIYGPTTTQEELYDCTTKSMVSKFIRGQNCLLFTYGATSSGKTYTVQGLCVAIACTEINILYCFFFGKDHRVIVLQILLQLITFLCEKPYWREEGFLRILQGYEHWGPHLGDTNCGGGGGVMEVDI